MYLVQKPRRILDITKGDAHYIRRQLNNRLSLSMDGPTNFHVPCSCDLSLGWCPRCLESKIYFLTDLDSHYPEPFSRTLSKVEAVLDLGVMPQACRIIERSEPCFITKRPSYTLERAHWVNAVRNSPNLKVKIVCVPFTSE